MLVKIKQMEDGRWRIRALGGEHYGQDLGSAKAVLLQRARFGYENLTGLLVGTWELEVYRHILGTKTCQALVPRSGELPSMPLTALRFQDEAGWFENKQSTKPLHEVGLILADADSVKYEKDVGKVKVNPQYTEEPKQIAKKGVLSRLRGLL